MYVCETEKQCECGTAKSKFNFGANLRKFKLCHKMQEVHTLNEQPYPNLIPYNSWPLHI